MWFLTPPVVRYRRIGGCRNPVLPLPIGASSVIITIYGHMRYNYRDPVLPLPLEGNYYPICIHRGG